MKTILLLDDEQTARSGTRVMLERFGTSAYNIVEFSNGINAISWLESNHADIAFVDMVMPHMNGNEFIKQAKQIDEKIQCVVLSGYDEFKLAAESMKNGAYCYLLKPVHRDEFIETLANLEKKIQIDQTKEDIISHAKKVYSSKYSKISRADSQIYIDEKDIDVAIEYINANYSKDINMAVVSNEIGKSYSYFSKLFKQKMGINFIEYLRKVRIEKAMGLLVSTNLKILNICEMVGYTNPKNFTTSFKDFCGTTPQDFRNMNKK